MDILSVLCERYKLIFRKHRIRKAILFGSFARGEITHHSDVDLILIQETNKPFFERYDDLYLDLNLCTHHRSVDILIYTPEELERISHRSFIAQALREGKVIYESE